MDYALLYQKQLLHTQALEQEIQRLKEKAVAVPNAAELGHLPFDCFTCCDIQDTIATSESMLKPYDARHLQFQHLDASQCYGEGTCNEVNGYAGCMKHQFKDEPVLFSTMNGVEKVVDYSALDIELSEFPEQHSLYSLDHSALTSYTGLDFAVPDIPEHHNFHLLDSLPQLSHQYLNQHLPPTPYITGRPLEQDMHHTAPVILNKKKYMEQEIHCSTCKTLVAIALLHCSQKSPCTDRSKKLLSSYMLDVECVNCEHIRICLEHQSHDRLSPLSSASLTLTSSPSNTSIQSQPAKSNPCAPCIRSKRKRTTDSQTLFCQVCKLRLALGGFRPLHLDPCNVSMTCAGHLVRTPTPIQTSIDIEGHASEIICAGCSVKYQFCSECGGGGKFRTGKYRPVEMFVAGRRVCIGSHIRLKESNVEYGVKDVDSIGKEALGVLKACFIDCNLTFLASPEQMEDQQSTMQTYPLLIESLERRWEEIERCIESEEGVFVSIATTMKVAKKGSDAVPFVVGFSVAHLKEEMVKCVGLCIRSNSVASVGILGALVKNACQAVRAQSDNEGKSIDAVQLNVLSEDAKMSGLVEKIGFVKLATDQGLDRFKRNIDHL